jgi:hypothetical protein
VSGKRQAPPRARLAPDEVTARAEKKLLQADFFAGHVVNITGPRLLPMHMEFYLSASLTAARSAFYIVRDHGGGVFRLAQKSWRRAHPPADMDFHQRMIDLRDEDVHHGNVDATSITKFVDARTIPGVQIFGNPIDAMVEETNPDGRRVRAQALATVLTLYIDHAGKRIEAATAARQFTALLWKLIAEFKRAATALPPSRSGGAAPSRQPRSS